MKILDWLFGKPQNVAVATHKAEVGGGLVATPERINGRLERLREAVKRKPELQVEIDRLEAIKASYSK